MTVSLQELHPQLRPNLKLENPDDSELKGEAHNYRRNGIPCQRRRCDGVEVLSGANFRFPARVIGSFDELIPQKSCSSVDRIDRCDDMCSQLDTSVPVDAYPIFSCWLDRDGSHGTVTWVWSNLWPWGGEQSGMIFIRWIQSASSRHALSRLQLSQGRERLWPLLWTLPMLFRFRFWVDIAERRGGGSIVVERQQSIAWLIGSLVRGWTRFVLVHFRRFSVAKRGNVMRFCVFIG